MDRNRSSIDLINAELLVTINSQANCQTYFKNVIGPTHNPIWSDGWSNLVGNWCVLKNWSNVLNGSYTHLIGPTKLDVGPLKGNLDISKCAKSDL